MLQLLGDSVLQTPCRGFAPEPHWGTSVPRPPDLAPNSTFSIRPAKEQNGSVVKALGFQPANLGSSSAGPLMTH